MKINVTDQVDNLLTPADSFVHSFIQETNT